VGDDPISMENPARWLVSVLGIVFCGAGAEAMITTQSLLSPFALASFIIGFLLLLFAAFWKKINFDKTAFATRLNAIASHPGIWIAVLAVVYLSTVTLNALKEIRENNEIVQQRNDEQAIAKVIERGLLPRHLDDDQKKVMGDFLLQFPPHQYAFELPRGDMEADSYRTDIESALMKGGWTGADNPYKYTEPADIQEGVNVTFFMSSSHTDTRADIRDPWPDRLVAIAFGLAQARMDDYGEQSGANINQDRLVIRIGKRRMDSVGFVPPKFRF
jgi:hypothetical protein